MRTKPICLAIALLFSIGMAAQTQTAPAPKSQKKVYSTSGGELIFSWASATQNSVDLNVITRFSPFFNFQSQLHMDVNNHFGFFTGLGVRNVGFIWDDPKEAQTRYKARTYTVGIPIGFKAGDMDGLQLFGGYEIEFPFNYKEKKFINEEKVSKATAWFSDKTPGLYNTVFVGIQTEQGIQIKFKYYVTNFFEKDYAANDGNGNIIYPYKDIEANVFYVSLSYQIFRGMHMQKMK